MTEKNESQNTKTLGLSRPGQLELKKTVEGGQVRQSFSHGRSKTVQVEVKKKRTFRRGSSGRLTEIKKQVPTGAPGDAAALAEAEAHAAFRSLTGEERAARARALESARLAEEDAQRQRVIEAHREAEEQRLRAEAEAFAAAVPAAAEAAPAEAAAPVPAAAVAAPEAAAAEAKAAKPAPRRREETREEGEAAPKRRKGHGHRLSIERRDQKRRAGKMTLVQALSDEERQRSLASIRRAREREKRAHARTGLEAHAKVVREVVVPEAITVQELASRMAVRGAEVVKAMMKLGVMATINQVIDPDTAELVVGEFGHRIKRVSEADVEVGLSGPEDLAEELHPRPPVVTVMGHVDHGKTSLLDALRKTDVAAGEAGGITQHIGAYQVEMPSGARITFLDTPGHAAFTQMRKRGANATDIVVLVIAADDGVMPQTVEAIQHAEAAGVPIIVAINKIDRPDANPEKVRNELLQHNIVVEEVGGDVLAVPVSATARTNLDRLEEAILLQAEVLELKANPDRPAEGVVIEAKRERGRGVVVTVLVQRGTLRVGDIMVAGSQWGRVRALVDDRGRNIKAAGPSEPVEVLGLGDIPQAGEEMVVVSDEGRAREVSEYRKKLERDKAALAASRGTVEQMLSQIAEGAVRELPIVVKADVHGSLEAILSNVAALTKEEKEVTARVLLAGVGGISESDITLAAASNAMVIGFNVRADAPARQLARRDGVDIRYYSVIYELLEDLRGMLSGLLKPTERESLLGYARIKEVFSITKVGKIAGCEVTEGTVRRGAKVRILRDSVVIHDGTLSSLKRHKDEVREVREGLECGMAFENYQDIREGDVIEVYDIEQVARELQPGAANLTMATYAPSKDITSRK
ncbi:MAG TPA: translation initiation factor IF-2 [Alphaproteobacteria bacterium]